MKNKQKKGGKAMAPVPSIYRNVVMMDKEGKPTGFIRKGQIPGSVIMRPFEVMPIKNYMKEKQNVLKTPKKEKYNLLKYNTDKRLLCMPQNFLYRQFRIPNGSNRSFFNFVSANNKKTFSNVLRVPTRISRGIISVGSGLQGNVLLGCIDDRCNTKVAIKIPKKGEAAAAAREFRNNKMIYKSCITDTPHIVQPIVLAKCGKSYVAYYEFFNGGSLDGWIKRHKKSLKLNDYKTILFQILYTMGAIYKKHPEFRHHDIHSGNIMVKTENVPSDGNTKYGKYSIKNNGIFTAVGDFGFSHSKKHPNPDVLSGQYGNYGVTKNSTIAQDIYVFISDLTKQAGYPEMNRFFESVTGFKISNKFKGDEFNIRMRTNTGKMGSIPDLLDNPFFDSIKVGQAMAPAPKAQPRKQVMNVAPKPASLSSTRCGARAIKGKAGILGMTTADMKKLIITQSEMKVPAGAKRADLCRMMSKFAAGRKALGIANKRSPVNAQAPKNMVVKPRARVVAARKAPSLMKIKKADNKVNITRRVRGVQKISVAPRPVAPKARPMPAPKVRPMPAPKARPMPAPKVAPKPMAPKATMDITRNNSGRVRIQRKVCDGQSRKMLDEMLIGFGMKPGDYKNKKAACDAIANAAQKLDMLGRYVTKAQETRETKKFMKNVKTGKF